MTEQPEMEGRATAPNPRTEFSYATNAREGICAAIRARVVLSDGAPLVVIRHGKSRTVMRAGCVSPLIDELIEVHRVLCLHGLERDNGDC